MKALLKKYRVDSANLLPVNADGLILQYNEDYQDQVFDHYYSQIEDTFNRQQSFLSMTGLLDPFISLKRLSMAMSGTDFYHHQTFFLQAKSYRNTFIRHLNLQLASHPIKSNETYKADPAFYAQLKDFQYQPPSLLYTLWLQRHAVLSLCCWVLSLSIIIRFITKSSLI